MAFLLRKYFARDAALLVAVFVFVVAQTLCDLEIPRLMSVIVDDGIARADTALVMQTGLYMLAWSAGALIASIVVALCAARASMGFGRRLREGLYTHVTGFALAEMDDLGASSLITRTTNDVQQLERFVLSCMTTVLMSPIMLIGSAFMAWRMNAQLSTIIFIAIPVLAVLAVLVMRLALPLLRILQVRIDRLNLVTREALTGLRAVRACRREDYEYERFRDASEQLAETSVSSARRMALLFPLVTIVLNLAIVLITWIGAGMVEAGGFEVGKLMALTQYAMQVMLSVSSISFAVLSWPRALAAADRVKEVLDTAPTVVDAEGAKETTVPVEANRAHELRFEGVEFGFPGAREPILRGVDLTLEAGKTYALVGSTGAGKTALVNLITRLYEPTAGRVLLDGVDIASMPQRELRRLISYAPQRAELFTGTIADNIRFGTPGLSDEDVEAAARIAHADEFIYEKPDGYETQVTQAASGLSGGQRQRITLARAFARRCGLYVFDDAFSALDFKTEALVRADMTRELAGATVLLVVQRVAAAKDADAVIVLDQGRVDSVGTHAQLLEQSQVYREIVESQLGEEGLR